jgi:hypothetical protein
MEALLLGLEMTLYLSNRLEVYMAYLATFPPSQARTNFESCLVEYHALVLRFLARAIRIYQRGSVARGFDAFWRVEDVATFEDECNKMASRAEIEASNCDRQGMSMILKQLEDLRLIHSNVQRLEAKVDLSKLPIAAGAAFNSYQDELDARCHPDTRRASQCSGYGSCRIHSLNHSRRLSRRGQHAGGGVWPSILFFAMLNLDERRVTLQPHT